MFAGACLTEESVESVIAATDCFVAGHLTIRLNAMLETEKLPASVSDLNTGLTEVKAKGLTHCA
jgi:hypothetical protein